MSDKPLDEEAVFKIACQIDSAPGRAEYLRQVCGDDGALHDRVARLVQEYRAHPSFLESPLQAFFPTLDMPPESRPGEGPGTVIGPYKLLQQIGEGGMGVVYMAEQAVPVRRKVALKIIKPGMDTREVIARFEAERQALALMDHPNIAKVFDGWTTDEKAEGRRIKDEKAASSPLDSSIILPSSAFRSGRPYFVMELVPGVPITDYCDQNNLPVHERLELFITVCHAVQHAHQKGIIHRDIKPSNVLVTLHDSRPVPKVIDFGVAKAIGQQLTDKTLFTQFAQMVGTPLYMSPEQAQLSGQDVDTRGDIYSLGVLLYELLTGTTPFERGRLKKAALDEIRRMIREEDPPKPSTRLSELSRSGLPSRTSGKEQAANHTGSARPEGHTSLASVAALRKTEPRRLSQLVRGDLDWIVMKALEKDRNRRYETANGFAADVVRFLSDEPVTACPPSTAYRFRKFARRNRVGLLTAGLLSAGLLVAMSAIGWAIRDRSAVVEEVARDRAAREARVEGRICEVLDEIQAAYDQDRLPEALAAVKHAWSLLTSDDVGSHEVRERIREWQSELEVVQRLDDLQFSFARDQSVETDAAYSRVFRGLGIDVDELPVAEAGKRIRSHITWQRLTEALDRWVAIRHEFMFGELVRDKDGLGKKRLLQVARAADSDDFRSQVRRAAELWDFQAAEKLASYPEVNQLPASTLRQLAFVIYYGGEKPDREIALRLLRGAQLQRPGDFRLYISSAIFYERMEPPGWSEAGRDWSIARALRPDDVGVRKAQAHVFYQMGEHDEAIAAYRRVIELDPTDVWGWVGRSASYERQGQYDKALDDLGKAVELEPKNASVWNNLGVVHENRKMPDEAIACFKKAIEVDPKFALAQYNLGLILGEQGKPDEAMAWLKKAIELDPKSARIHDSLGTVLREQAQSDEAIASYRQAIELAPSAA
ncbi:MAG TPA: serine/threonine-protein kinase, partial [Planctomycetaceae bacterium]